ncbi:MAG: hypothetical protein K2I73_08520 [Eubacterium sp.]|nr:hypothetical protein [Eubacterium sp.]
MAEAKKKRKFSFRKLVYNDRYLIACSIIAAIVIWVATSMNLSPNTTKTITVPVKIDFSDTLAEQLGIEYYGQRDLTVDVKISCKKYLAKDINEESINAFLQTSNVTSTGYLSVPIRVSPVDDDAEFSIDSWYPTSAQGYFDVAQKETMPLTLNFTNDSFAADGYVVGDVAVNPNTVVVSGPRTSMENVDKVIADITLETGLTESQRVDLKPKAVDKDGKTVDNISFDIPEGENFVATIPILKVQNLKPSVSFVSGPDNAPDFLNIDYSVDSVQVGALESAKMETLNLGNVSFADLNLGENVFEFDTGKISGIKVLDGTEKITVTITVPEDYATKYLEVYKRDIHPELDDFNVEITGISTNSVKIAANKNIIDTIDKSSLSFSLTPLDGTDTIDEKTKTCRLSIIVNSKSESWVIGNYTVNVNVTPKEN